MIKMGMQLKRKRLRYILLYFPVIILLLLKVSELRGYPDPQPNPDESLYKSRQISHTDTTRDRDRDKILRTHSSSLSSSFPSSSSSSSSSSSHSNSHLSDIENRKSVQFVRNKPSSSSSSSSHTFPSHGSSSSSSSHKNESSLNSALDLLDDYDDMDDDYDYEDEYEENKHFKDIKTAKGVPTSAHASSIHHVNVQDTNTHSHIGPCRIKWEEEEEGRRLKNLKLLDKSQCPKELDRCVCGYGLRFPKEHHLHHHNCTSLNSSKFLDSFKFVVNCTDTGFTSLSVSALHFLPDKTEELIFTGNEIPVLPINILGDKDYPHLKFIDFSNNKIQEIKGKAFHHVSSVEKLVLNYNNISTSGNAEHPRIFSNFINLRELHLTDSFNGDVWLLSDLSEIFIESNLTKLERLHLEGNDIEMIKNPDLLCDLPSLVDIYIARNKLPDLNLNVTCLPNLRYIDASYNFIRTIDENSGIWEILHARNGKGSEIKINLLSNPFECDCKLESFLNWYQQSLRTNVDRFPFHENTICNTGFPATNRGLNLFRVNTTALRCQTFDQILQYKNTAASSVTYGIVWFLAILILAVVAFILLFVNRASISRTINMSRPLIMNHGVKYTSIENETAATGGVIGGGGTNGGAPGESGPIDQV